MQNSYYNKNVYTIINLIAIFLSFIQIFADLKTIQLNSLNFSLYLIPRILIVLNLLGIYFYHKKNQITENSIIYLWMSVLIYALHGQWFSSGYFLAHIQSTLAISLFFGINRKRYIKYLVFSTISLIILIKIGSSSYSSIDSLSNKYKNDMSIATIIMSILSFLIFNFITLVKQQKEKVALKFSDIGKNVASIIHDIKGVACAPQLYIELIQAKVDSGNFEGIDKDLIRLQEEYDNLVEYVKDLNNVSKEKEGIKKFDILSLSNSVGNIFLKSRMKGTKFSVKGVQFVEADFQLTRSIFTNLIVNSLDAFEAKKITDRQINVEISKQKIKFMDNAGGFPAEVLERVKRKESMTTKENGSGLGLFLIQEYMNEQGGKAHFYNEDSKAVVELHFKENNIKK